MRYKKGDFIVLPNLSTVQAMRGAPVHLYIALLACSNQHGECWPSKKKLSDMTGYDTKTCQRAIRALEDEGLVRSIERFRANGGQASNGYQLLIKE